MKKGFLFCLVILLCFMVTSCDEFGLKTICGFIYFRLPSSNKVEIIGTLEGYEFELPEEIIVQERKKELQEEYPQISIFKQEDDLQLYEFLLHRTVSTRKDFVIDIILQTDEKKYSGKIEIPYLSSEGGIVEVKLINEDNEKFDGIFVYKFWRTI